MDFLTSKGNLVYAPVLFLRANLGIRLRASLCRNSLRDSISVSVFVAILVEFNYQKQIQILLMVRRAGLLKLWIQYRHFVGSL